MANVNIVIGTTLQSSLNTVMMDTTNPRRPFYKGAVQAVHQFKMGTDFQSGDNVILEIKEATEIIYADIKEDGGNGVFANKSFTEAQTNAPNAGFTITAANCIGNLKVNIYGDVR